MTTVIVQAVASLDGYVARPDDMPGPIFDWYEAGDVELRFNPEHAFHVSEQSAAYLQHHDVKCQIIGRHLFDLVDGWGGRPIVGDHVFVVTHHDDADEWRSRYPEAPYTFCTDGVQDAVRRATEHAGDGSVIVSAGEVAGQVVAAGLADELAIDLAPVFLGEGKKFLGSLTDEILLEDPHVVIQGERVLHLRYALRR
ncbi:MAG TPA: dihydrofolate reductase family protein [Nocardioides sp.]|uniref:dihydrofolate reductase family protein n=1 Tax=Nocardioides sp. TaxID=35761 RepID=UPI002F3F0269